MSDLESMSDDTLATLLQHVLVEYVILTNLEGPAQPTLTRREIIALDTTRKEARAAAIAAAAAAAADSGDGDGDRGGDGDGDGGGDGGGDDASKVTRTRPPSRRRREGQGAVSEPFVGRLIPWHNCHGGAWDKTHLITHTRVRIE
jgi:hypothetical protein